MACGVTETDPWPHETPRVQRHQLRRIPKNPNRLRRHGKISAIWPREFESHGISVLDVETRLAFNASGVGTTAPAAGAQGDAPSDDKPWWKVW